MYGLLRDPDGTWLIVSPAAGGGYEILDTASSKAEAERIRYAANVALAEKTAEQAA